VSFAGNENILQFAYAFKVNDFFYFVVINQKDHEISNE